MALTAAQKKTLYDQTQASGTTPKTAQDYINIVQKSPLGYGSASPSATANTNTGAYYKAAASVNSGTSGTSAADDYSQYLEDAAKKATKAKVQALQSAQESALSALDTQREKIAPVYYDKRNVAASQSDLTKRNYNEYAAATGLNSGANAQMEISRANALQGNLGNLATQETQANADIEAQRSSLANEYSSLIAQAKTQAQADLLTAQYNEKIRAASAAAQAAETQKADFQNTLGAYSSDYQKQVDTVKNDADTSNDWQIPYLQAARQQKLAAQQESETQAQDTARETALTLWKTQGVANEYVSYVLGVPVGAKTADYAVDIANATKKASSGSGSGGTKSMTFAQAVEAATNNSPNQAAANVLKAYGWTDADIEKAYPNLMAGTTAGDPVPFGTTDAPSTKTASSDWTGIDRASVTALGRGPLSRAALESLIESGQVIARVKDGEIYVYDKGTINLVG